MYEKQHHSQCQELPNLVKQWQRSFIPILLSCDIFIPFIVSFVNRSSPENKYRPCYGSINTVCLFIFSFHIHNISICLCMIIGSMFKCLRNEDILLVPTNVLVYQTKTMLFKEGICLWGTKQESKALIPPLKSTEETWVRICCNVKDMEELHYSIFKMSPSQKNSLISQMK